MVIPSFNLLLAACLVLAAAEWTRRIFWMARFRRLHPPLVPASAPRAPKVSIVVPARNEEKNIARCLATLAAQDYPDYEIVVVNDRSTDRTAELVDAAAKASRAPVRRVDIGKLPPGWTGKNHAVFAGSKAAHGEWFLFTDADTAHRPHCVSTAMAAALGRGIDLLTLAPETECRTFWENVVQPVAVSSIALWFDPVKINDPESGVVIANGQFMLVSRGVYEKTGGNESVKSEVVEDVEYARRVVAAGHTVRFLDGTRLYSTRMYSTLAEIKTGWARIFTHLFKKSVAAVAGKIFLFLFFSLMPFAALAWQVALKAAAPAAHDAGLFALALAVSAWIVAIRFVGNKMVRSNPWYAFAHPLGSVVMVWILSICVWRILANRPSPWRGDLHR